MRHARAVVRWGGKWGKKTTGAVEKAHVPPPDLGRLALCPTWAPNDAEAGSSQSVAGPNQRAPARRRIVPMPVAPAPAAPAAAAAPAPAPPPIAEAPVKMSDGARGAIEALRDEAQAMLDHLFLPDAENIASLQRTVQSLRGAVAKARSDAAAAEAAVAAERARCEQLTTPSHSRMQPPTHPFLRPHLRCARFGMFCRRLRLSVSRLKKELSPIKIERAAAKELYRKYAAATNGGQHRLYRCPFADPDTGVCNKGIHGRPSTPAAKQRIQQHIERYHLPPDPVREYDKVVNTVWPRSGARATARTKADK